MTQGRQNDKFKSVAVGLVATAGQEWYVKIKAIAFSFTAQIGGT